MSVENAVLTLWYVTVADPGAVLAREPKADRGFGRKYLAQLNPLYPVTPIGQFPLNRSAQADEHEFYIGGYPGVTVVQTVIHAAENSTLKLSELDASHGRLLNAVPAEDIFIFATNDQAGWAGFAHWHDGEPKRVFSGTRFEATEDIGLPEGFEGPYWAGEKAEPLGGISLPFEPADLTAEAQRHWLGVSVDDTGPDLQVVGYAVDGRPEPKIAAPSRIKSVQQLSDEAASKLGLGPNYADYDDYEDSPASNDLVEGDEFKRFTQASAALARRIGMEAGSVARRVGSRARRWLQRN
ncbi:MAG: hypothetical protein SOW59_01755 [Corynebacterium sp.]|nr:hypothetical protein [Corynebacterium sp.]